MCQVARGPLQLGNGYIRVVLLSPNLYTNMAISVLLSKFFPFFFLFILRTLFPDLHYHNDKYSNKADAGEQDSYHNQHSLWVVCHIILPLSLHELFTTAFTKIVLITPATNINTSSYQLPYCLEPRMPTHSQAWLWHPQSCTWISRCSLGACLWNTVTALAEGLSVFQQVEISLGVMSQQDTPFHSLGSSLWPTDEFSGLLCISDSIST